jgi:hypothetical protein
MEVGQQIGLQISRNAVSTDESRRIGVQHEDSDRVAICAIKIIGAPPGYVAWQEEAILGAPQWLRLVTGAIRPINGRPSPA